MEKTDALLVWGGDPVYLCYWMRQSGLTGLLQSLRREVVYVGVSSGSMAASSTFGEAYSNPPGGSGGVSVSALTSEEIVFTTPKGNISRTFVTTHGAGLADFALIPHLDLKTTRTLPRRTQKNGLRGYRFQCMRLTMRQQLK